MWNRYDHKDISTHPSKGEYLVEFESGMHQVASFTKDLFDWCYWYEQEVYEPYDHGDDVIAWMKIPENNAR